MAYTRAISIPEIALHNIAISSIEPHTPVSSPSTRAGSSIKMEANVSPYLYLSASSVRLLQERLQQPFSQTHSPTSTQFEELKALIDRITVPTTSIQAQLHPFDNPRELRRLLIPFLKPVSEPEWSDALHYLCVTLIGKTEWEVFNTVKKIKEKEWAMQGHDEEHAWKYTQNVPQFEPVPTIVARVYGDMGDLFVGQLTEIGLVERPTLYGKGEYVHEMVRGVIRIRRRKRVLAVLEKVVVRNQGGQDLAEIDRVKDESLVKNGERSRFDSHQVPPVLAQAAAGSSLRSRTEIASSTTVGGGSRDVVADGSSVVGHDGSTDSSIDEIEVPISPTDRRFIRE